MGALVQFLNHILNFKKDDTAFSKDTIYITTKSGRHWVKDNQVVDGSSSPDIRLAVNNGLHLKFLRNIIL